MGHIMGVTKAELIEREKADRVRKAKRKQAKRVATAK
jgi:hypothetical protein